MITGTPQAPGTTLQPQPYAAVVIPTCNSPDLLQKCLDALARSLTRVADTPIDVIVTDDGAGTASRDLVAASYPWVRWIQGPRRGPAANRNNGVRASAGSWIFFTDDDCIPEEGWLQAFVESIRKTPDCKVFEGRTVTDRERQRMDEESPENQHGGYLWSCNVAIERAFFDRLGGFCETFPAAAMEDVDLRLRIQACNERFDFVPAAVVCHPYRPGKGLRFWIRHGESYVHLTERHPQLLGDHMWRVLPRHIVRRTVATTRGAVRYRFRGLLHTAGVLCVLTWFDIVARLRATRRRGTSPSRASSASPSA